MQTLSDFQKKRDILFCFDSDGCVLDAMEVKHRRCHGLCFIREWGLMDHFDEVMDKWCEINLYETTRGIHRYKALVIMLERLEGKLLHTPELEAFKTWVNTTPMLTNASLEDEIAKRKNQELFSKALRWSYALNREIDKIPMDDKPPYPGVPEKLAAVQEKVDVGIVSSSNLEAITEEWSHFGLLDHVDCLTSQNDGSKAHCLAQLLRKGYDKDKVVMVGDAFGDQAAARENGVWFFPIRVRHEVESWNQLLEEALPKILKGQYDQAYQQSLDQAFEDSFHAGG
ncbi:MAG: HAD family hydrolase [Christensenellales bacterium]|jgi:phosphoglycolate phosphatase-like HAD superfamily hydrolase